MKYPRHVAVIPDGNRTRARANGESVESAYLISYKRGVDLVRYTFTNTDVKVFTLRGLSTENANKRPPKELDFLMNMYKIIDEDLDEFLIENNINFKWIGNPNGITADFKYYLDQKAKRTKCSSDRYFVFAINYGGRDEILRAIHKLKSTDITEEEFSKTLDLGKLPNIELVIRTKGDYAHRTSGFMSRWIGYAELYFTKDMCPEFDVKSYIQALERFDKVQIHRNYGK